MKTWELQNRKKRDWLEDSKEGHWYAENIIVVNEVRNIPCDYFGAMAVPITYLYSHDDTLFEIIGLTGGNLSVGGRNVYKRLVIIRKDR